MHCDGLMFDKITIYGNFMSGKTALCGTQYPTSRGQLMKKLESKFVTTGFIVTLLIWLPMVGLSFWLFFMHGLTWHMLIPFVVAVTGEAVSENTLTALEKTFRPIEDRQGVLVAMIRNLETSPGEHGEFDQFVFTFLIPCLRKNPKEHAELIEVIPNDVMARLAVAVNKATEVERTAFINREAATPTSSDFAEMAGQLKQLEDLFAALRDEKERRTKPKAEVKWPSRASLSQSSVN